MPMKKDSTTQKGGRTLYQLWGCDTFSNEIYNCGAYRHRSSAYRAKRNHEEEVSTTQEDLRDTYWIVPITEEGYIIQQKERRHEIEAKAQLKATNQAFVNENSEYISKKCHDLVLGCEFDNVIQKTVRTKNDNIEKELIEIPGNLMIGSIFIYISKDKGKGKYKYYFAIRTKDIPNTTRDGVTLIYLCSGTIEDFKLQVNECISPEWIRSTLNRVIEKNIYET